MLKQQQSQVVSFDSALGLSIRNHPLHPVTLLVVVATLASRRQARSPQSAVALQPRIYRLALQRQDAKDALVDAPQRLAADEALQCFDPQRELT
jgi:hypothetical protein